MEQIECGALDSSVTHAMLERFLAPLLAKEIDTVVLGCTHYRFVQPLIEQIVGSHIQVIDTGPAVARHVERLLDEHAIANRENQGSVRFFTSGDAAALQPLFATLWGSPVALKPLG